MAEQLYKLSPDRDLQCYFYMPSAIAAMSGASPNGFTLSGSWRQQFDWAVVEWNRDNVFEHPALRYLPDGDLSGLQLSYQETRTNCIPFESSLYPTVDWPSLRIWAQDDSGNEQLYYVRLIEHAKPAAGSYQAARATMTLTGTATPGNVICICMPTPNANGYAEQNYSYQLTASDTLATAAANLATLITNQAQGWTATSSGSSITLSWMSAAGSDGNRITIYGTASAGATISWASPATTLSGGAFPSTYQVTLDFTSLMGYTQPPLPGVKQAQVQIPTSRIRKMRWTWAPDLQPGSFERQPFSVTVSNWTVTGTNREYYVAGPGSRRIEDDDPIVAYTSGNWQVAVGNFSGSTIRYTANAGATCSITYSETATHQLYVGSRLLAGGALLNVSIDQQAPQQFNLNLPGEDVLVRLPLGTLSAGTHTIMITHSGQEQQTVYFDFLEIAYPSLTLPDFPAQPQLALATDWDTYHSQSLPAERTAWMIQKLGFTGRVNHYAGALWFYELALPGHVYNSATVTFTQVDTQSTVSGYVILQIGPEGSPTQIEHLNLPWDTPATVAQALANLINNGFTQVWASANENQLTVIQRSLTPWNGQPDGAPQLQISIVSSGSFSGTLSSSSLSGGVPGTPYDDTLNQVVNNETVAQFLLSNTGYWRTDFTSTLNQAARDWSLAYFKALAGYGIEVVVSFSTELKNADPNVSTGLAQRRSDGSPVIVATPAVMTNFSPICTQFWKQVYLDMAGLQAAAGLIPYLQFGEVQWWYFPWNRYSDATIESPVSMPFYDAYTTQQFEAQYGAPMQIIANENADPSQYSNEVAFLPTLIGAHTAAIRSALQSQYPGCRCEVLYPTDTNNTALNRLINYPTSDWTPQNLACLKTESFTFTGANNLDLSAYSMSTSATKGFLSAQRSHLVGIGNAYTAWMKEVDMAQSQGMESVVLFALDQYCLIGYPPPPFIKSTRATRQG
jgi:hypothetical protein